MRKLPSPLAIALGLIMLGSLGYLINLLLLGMEHVALRWHRGLKARTRDA